MRRRAGVVVDVLAIASVMASVSTCHDTHAAPPCERVVRVVNGRFFAPDGTTPVGVCDGDVLPPTWGARLVEQAKCEGPKADLVACREAAERQRAADEQALQLERDARLVCEAKRCPPAAKEAPGFFEQPVVVFIGGVLVGAAVAVGVAAAL